MQSSGTLVPPAHTGSGMVGGGMSPVLRDTGLLSYNITSLLQETVIEKSGMPIEADNHKYLSWRGFRVVFSVISHIHTSSVCSFHFLSLSRYTEEFEMRSFISKSRV